MDSNRATKLRSRSRSRGGCAAAKSASIYDDDVFGSPALSPSEEDYIEMFGGFHGARGASGIPVLDLPPVDEKEALFDFRLFDYSEVFGGFEGLDYVVPFQELFRRSNGGYVSSSDDAWTNVETDCLSEEWDGSPYSSKCKSYGNESNQQSIKDGKQLHMSYQRKHQMNEEGVSNTAHVAPVRAVPGYAFVIDQIAPSQKIESQNSHLHIDGDDDKLIKRGKREEELSEKLASAVELEKGHVRNGSQSNEMYFTISEINLRTLPSDGPPPSRPPPIFDARYGNSREATSSLKATCNSKCFSRGTSGNDSPPFVDVELDARISATESAASVTESVKNSQAKPKTIKENLQLKNVVMSQVSVCPKDEAKCNVAVGKSHNSCKDQEDDTCTLEDYAQHPSRKEIYSGLNNAQSLPDVMGLNPMLNLMGKNKSKQSWSSEESCEARLSGEWSKVPEFIELVRYGKTKTSQQESGDDIIVQNRIIKECVKEEKRVPKKEKINQRVYIATNKLEDHVKISEAASKMSKQDKNYKEFHVSLQIEQCEEVERQVNEEDPQMEDDIFIEIMKNEHETEKELNKIKRKVKLGDDEERMEDPRKIHEVGPTESFVTAEDDRRVNDDLSIGPGEINIRENCQQAIFLTTPRKSCEIELENLNEQALSEVRKEAHNEQQNGRVMKSNIEQERREPCFKETFEDIKKRKKSLKESLVLEETKRKTKEILEKEENERRKKEEEYVAKLMEASDNEADEMLKEALEEVNKRILMEDLERTEREKKMYMISERTSEKQPNVRKVTRGGPIMMTGSRRSSNLTSEIDIGIEATNLRSYQAEKLKEENIFNSECDSEQENAKSTLEFITVVGKKSNYNQASDGGVISEYIPGAGTNEQLSDAKENINLVNGTSMSTNASGEAALHSDQIGVKRNNKLPNVAPDSTNLQKNVKVGKVTMPEKAQAQTKAPPHDDVNTDKDKLAQKADGEMTNSKGSESTKPQMSGGRKQTQNQSHQSKTNQIVGGKEKCRKDNSTPEEREKLERLRKEREIELERLREMEEEWEREREREKDRVAFESVNRNFQEKAYPGLRERAAMDKASADPRQKDLAKARERLEKSYSDKISMEAKMRQEQSAVERANVEAREHADRSILSSAAMHPSTSIYTDKVEGIEGESTQRCRAILERHQRTAERAAKALAEKNTRDLIAQREQAERHRLAESLDVEVKRWSNGKQGNLRALLSTLQYILGPESGWQPVPLTGIITSAAVKKSYRRATLCVHPDKLQQRRATIQQKYICEKVFDLLKEAWNRFNSEEP